MTGPVSSEQVPEQLRALGWVETIPSALRLESAGPRGYRFGRAWSRAGTYESLPEAGLMTVVVPVEGTGVIVHDGVEIPYSPNQLVLLDGAAASTIELHQPTARHLWRIDASRFPDLRANALFGEAIPVPPAMWRIARGLTNSLIEAGPEVWTSHHLVRANEQSLAAVLLGATSAFERRTPEEIHAEALAHIRERQDDPTFTLTRLVRELRVTEAALQRAFATAGRTPIEVLDRERATALHARWGEEELPEGEYARSAEASGFTSTAQGRRAVARLLRGIAKTR